LKQLDEDLVIDLLRVETLRKPSTGLKLQCWDAHDLAVDGRDTQKTQHGIETMLSPRWRRLSMIVETLRKPSTGLKHDLLVCGENGQVVETLRKPSTGLKQQQWADPLWISVVETLRKPSTGLKPLL